jgi:hypothetical protein
MKNTFRTVFIITLFGFINLKGQSIDPPVSLDIVMQVVSNDNTMLPGDSLFKSTTNLIGKAIVVVNDTIGLNKLHLKLGTTDGSGNLLTKTFNYAQQGNFPDGTSYTRNKNIIYLNLGNYTGLNFYFGEVTLEDTQGALTQPKKYSN